MKVWIGFSTRDNFRDTGPNANANLILRRGETNYDVRFGVAGVLPELYCCILHCLVVRHREYHRSALPKTHSEPKTT